MSEYKLKNSGLSADEIVMVYLEEGVHKKTFYHREYTDYLNA